MFAVFSRRDVDAATLPEVLAEARALVAQVEDVGSDEWSVWGSVGDIDAGSLLLHHTVRPLVGECPCGWRKKGLCVHITALALAELGDTEDLGTCLGSLPAEELVALLCEVADHSPLARQHIQIRLSRLSK